MAEYIKKKDTLNQGRVIINEELTKANDNASSAKSIANSANNKSDNAVNVANQSMQQSTSTQNQLDDLIIHSGTSDAEVIQARTDEKGHTHNTLKKRIDDSFDEVTSQLADKADLADINILDVEYGEIELPSDFPHTLPFKLTAIDENTIEHGFDINTYKAGAGAVYLDSTSHPSYDGSTPHYPTMFLDQALETAEALPQETVVIYIMNKYYPRNYTRLIGQNVTLTKNIVFAPYQRDYAIIGSFEEPSLLSWSKDGKAYKTTRTATHCVLDLSVKFKGNEPTKYKKVNSVAEVQAEEGTFYINGSDVWVRRFGDKEPDNDLLVMISIGNTSFTINDKKLVFDRVSWFWYHSASSSDSLNVSGNENSELVLYKSSFAYAAANGLATNKVGKVFNIESLAYNNGTDGFNYHGTLVENPYEFVYEYYTEAFDNGFNGLDNNNGSTAHEGLSILRVNTLTYRSEGPIIADVNGCYSILINCVSHSSTRNVSSRLKAAFFFNNTSAVKPGKAILINCGGGGKDTYAVASDANFDIQVRRFKGSNWWHETLDSVKFI